MTIYNLHQVPRISQGHFDHTLFTKVSKPGKIVTWRSKKQGVVAKSSAEVEYRADFGNMYKDLATKGII